MSIEYNQIGDARKKGKEKYITEEFEIVLDLWLFRFKVVVHNSHIILFIAKLHVCAEVRQHFCNQNESSSHLRCWSVFDDAERFGNGHASDKVPQEDERSDAQFN